MSSGMSSDMSSDGPALHIRDVRDGDLGAVHAINEGAVPHVNSISLDRFRVFSGEAAYFRVALLGADLAGYLVAFSPDAGYDSLNFLWFRERYGDFIYIDRIAVAENARRHRVASNLYRDFLGFAGSRTRLVTCEVNTRPANAGSMAFHERFGFHPVGTQETDGGNKSVCLMAMNLNPPV
jgi:predicted GNAT superfamily acetyltransferase